MPFLFTIQDCDTFLWSDYWTFIPFLFGLLDCDTFLWFDYWTVISIPRLNYRTLVPYCGYFTAFNAFPYFKYWVVIHFISSTAWAVMYFFRASLLELGTFPWFDHRAVIPFRLAVHASKASRRLSPAAQNTMTGEAWRSSVFFSLISWSLRESTAAFSSCSLIGWRR